MDRGKNTIRNVFIEQTICFLEGELPLLQLRIAHPERFIPKDDESFHPDLHLDLSAKDWGIVGMAEIVVAFHLSGCILKKDGQTAPLIQIANAFEQVFDFRFGDIYDKRSKVFIRKPYNQTRTLDMLRNCIVREGKRTS